MKQVLYISYDGMTDALGRSQVLPYLEGLSRKGFKITLISAEKPEAFEKGNDEMSVLIEHMGIDWHPVKYTKRPPVLSTIWDIRRMRKKAIKLDQIKSFEIVHCRSYISAFVGLAMKKRFGCRFIFDMRGFYADERVDGNIWPQSNPIYRAVYRYFKRKEIVFLSESDAIVSLTNAAKQEILSWNLADVPEEKISVIPCCADLDFFDFKRKDEVKVNQWKTKLEIHPETFVLSYLGSVGTWYMLPEMMDFYQQFLSSKPDSVFLFITRDNPLQIFEEALKREIDPKHIKVQPATREQVPELAMLSDASLFFIKPVWSKKASSPTKLAELMGMGIPVFANKGVGDVDRVIEQNPAGFLIDGFTSDDYQKAINEFLKMEIPDRLAAREIACENFSLEKGISTFETIYNTAW